jgi:hypothetical protein
MPTGKEFLDAIEFLKHGGPAAVVGLVLGCVLYAPLTCGPDECENLVGHHVERVGFLVADFEWVKGIIFFIVVFAIAGWIGSGLVGALKGESQ